MALTCDRVRELASGFVLGALDPKEMIAVSGHLKGCRKPHPEIDDLGGVLPYIAESLEPVEPPAWLRDSVIAAARADLVARRRVGKPSEQRAAEPVMAPAALPAAPAPVATQPRRLAPTAEIIAFPAARASRRRRVLTWATRAAAAVAIVALAGYSFVLQGELSRAQEVQAHYESIVYALGQSDTRSTQLAAVDGSSASGTAALRPSGHIIVYLHGLPATKGDQVYMVWLAGNSGSWTKLGSVTVDDSGVGYLEVDTVPTTANLWLYVCRESNAKVTEPGQRVLMGIILL
ncbi:MAG: zf-HC2 domain-containing protein [Candidatus Limnocylindrales bacterium]